MAKIKITLMDDASGNVRVDSDPPMPKLAEMARAGDLTPAEGYALAALAKIIKDSQQEAVKKAKDKGLYMPNTPRFLQ